MIDAAALLELGRYLRDRTYRFVTPTPATIVRVNRRPDNRLAVDLAGIFGWSRPFPQTLLDAELFARLRDGQLIVRDQDAWRSTVRASTVDDAVYFHSAFPTEAADSVFFGPDSYRFVRVIEDELADVLSPCRILDLGCGSGVGGLQAARRLGAQAELTLSDVNGAALAFARVNAALMGRAASCVESDLFAQLPGSFDLILANPPYMMDERRRTYRDGGDRLGAALSLRILDGSLAHLAQAGRLILYTGAAIRRGRDEFAAAVAARLAHEPVCYSYREIDPDVFGEELDKPAYRDVERIAVVALTVTHTP